MTSLSIDPAKPASRVPMDQLSKRILRCLATNVAPDVGAIAKDVGANEDVVRHRLGTLQDCGVLRGFNVRLDHNLLGQSYEFLVSGVASQGTDKQAIGRLCSATEVTRVFGLASSRSVAFTVVGADPAATQARAMALAQEAGLVQPQAVLIVNTFHDGAGSALTGAVATEMVAA
ncbi:MAG TPA: Lrp/AsnC family transcriptional regulator [Candidatus Thermoplasmatota archaeon]|nr:Lrp/AsnC family transcriptional regulator [Candidatus Thermoplasmatota archaeon]